MNEPVEPNHATTRRFPVPMPFLIAVVAVVFIIIFFGAWAVSTDADGRAFSLAYGSGATAPSSQAISGTAASAAEDGENSWWESAVLKACPFH